MEEKIKISSSRSEFLSGSSKYNITLEIINLTGKSLYDLRVKSIAVPGKLLSIQGDPSYGKRYKGDIYYEAILDEIQLQIFKAYKILEENEKRALIIVSATQTKQA
jgi:anionic cell wall polymer biosynthesis LytR-Cps2A-Psr (LCP) family protein